MKEWSGKQSSFKVSLVFGDFNLKKVNAAIESVGEEFGVQTLNFLNYQLIIGQILIKNLDPRSLSEMMITRSFKSERIHGIV